MNNLVDVSDELKILSKELLETIEKEDREYEFRTNKGYVERNILVSEFKRRFTW